MPVPPKADDRVPALTAPKPVAPPFKAVLQPKSPSASQKKAKPEVPKLSAAAQRNLSLGSSSSLSKQPSAPTLSVAPIQTMPTLQAPALKGSTSRQASGEQLHLSKQLQARPQLMNPTASRNSSVRSAATQLATPEVDQEMADATQTAADNGNDTQGDGGASLANQSISRWLRGETPQMENTRLAELNAQIAREAERAQWQAKMESALQAAAIENQQLRADVKARDQSLKALNQAKNEVARKAAEKVKQALERCVTISSDFDRAEHHPTTQHERDCRGSGCSED